jgi:hypothetical protein
MTASESMGDGFRIVANRARWPHGAIRPIQFSMALSALRPSETFPAQRLCVH